MGWPEPVGQDHVREVRPASALEPPGRALRAGRRSDRAFDHGRCHRRSLCLAGSPAALVGSSCHEGRAFMPMIRPCRCWPGAKPIRDDAGSTSGMTGRLGGGSAGGDVLLLTRPQGRASPGASGGHAGILQADAYDGYNQLYLAGRQPGPIRETACWPHGRRPFFAIADIEEKARRKAGGKKEIPLSPIDRGRAEDRCTVRDRALHQRQECRGAP
ncbi:hypothetical protein ABH973_000783 [Bradyrhizobium ottawaense]